MTSLHIAVLLFALFSSYECSCRNANWWGSFDQKNSLSKCDGESENINGFWRSKRLIPDRISFIELARCCTLSQQYQGKSTQVEYEQWSQSFDLNNHWNMCPKGFFLQGLYRGDSDPGTDKDRLWVIEQGRCMKPSSLPRYYRIKDDNTEDCYDEDITLVFDKANWGMCRTGYFITGLYRGVCDELFCLEKLKCCKMADKPEHLDSPQKVKEKMMDETMSEMAKLADFLGYGNAQGCWANGPGEDFKLDGDSWKAQDRLPCVNKYRRLGIKYGDWKFLNIDMTWGQPNITDIKAETIDSGSILNYGDVADSQSFTRKQTISRTITHTASRSTTTSNGFDVSIGYSPGIILGGPKVEASYSFNYDKTSSSSDSSAKEVTESTETTSSVTVPPHTMMNYTVMRSQTKRTINYTAIIRVQFSAEFNGFMKPGRNGNNHVSHQTDNNRPNVEYKFGDGSHSFYDKLKEQSSKNTNPWKWTEMFNIHPKSKTIVDSLIDQKRYEFTLTGRFDDVTGKDVRVVWDSSKLPVSASSGLVGRSLKDTAPVQGGRVPVLHSPVAR